MANKFDPVTLLFLAQCKETPSVAAPIQEYPFHPTRRWRFDFAWPATKVAMEKEGVIYNKGGGRHQQKAGYEADCEKYAEALCLGWRVLRVTPKQIREGKAIRWLRQIHDE